MSGDTPLPAADEGTTEEKAEASKPEPAESSKDAKEKEEATKPTATRRLKEDEIDLDEMEMDEDLRKALHRQRARKRSKHKRLQYNFLFKSGAFIVMLVFVLIMKQVQKYFPNLAGGAPAGPVTDAPAHATASAKPEL